MKNTTRIVWMLAVLSTFAVAANAQAAGKSAEDGASTPPAVMEIAQATRVIRGEFGLFSEDADGGEPHFVRSKTVPLVPGQSYGWVIAVRSNQQRIHWREELTLPASPVTWGAPETQGRRALSDDGRVAITEREVDLGDGLIYNAWDVAAGDPQGRYRIRVFVEGTLAKVFEFDVR